MDELTKQDRAELQKLVSDMEFAWNRGDASSYVAAFTDDADFVVINGQRLKGRKAILSAHEYIFQTIYARSTIAYQIEQARLLSNEVAIVHLYAILRVPTGPLAGEVEARPTLMVVRHEGDWRVAALQNTEVKELTQLARPHRE